MCSERVIRQTIIKAMSEGLTIREVQEQMFPSVPAGTLCNIKNGRPIPDKWRAYFGVKQASGKKRCPSTLPIIERPVWLLAWQLEHREVM